MFIVAVSSIILFMATLFSPVASIIFPAPTGPYNTSLIIKRLVDSMRLDPFSPTPQPRAVMISLFHPVSPSACTASLVPYMDSATAAFEDTYYSQYVLPNGTFELLDLQVCNPDKRSSHSTKVSTFPVVLFSGALGTSRLFYSALAQQISSAGYIVATIDHPYDAYIVTFPDNTAVFMGNISSDAQVNLTVDTRAKGISFVLNQLGDSSTVKSLIPGSTRGLNIQKAGVYGHSVGSTSAAAAMLYDTRLVGGLNLDGTFFGPVVEKGLSRPFLIFGHEGKNTSTDYSWDAIWPKLTGWKRELMLNASQHYTFSDLPEIVDVLKIGSALPTEVAQLLGTIDGTRAHEIIGLYVSAFFDFVLKAEKSTILDKVTASYPEVSFGSP